MKVLIVVKDISPGKLVSALISELRTRRFEEIVIVAEAASLSVLDQAGIPIKYRGPEKFDQKNLWTLDFSAILDQEDPDVVITGLSFPMNLEKEFLLVAKGKGIPTVALVDNWGGRASRSFWGC